MGSDKSVDRYMTEVCVCEGRRLHSDVCEMIER